MRTAGTWRSCLLWAWLVGCSLDAPTTTVDRPAHEGAAPASRPVEAVSWARVVHPVGRHRWVTPTQLRYGWSGSGFAVRFSGTSVHVRLDDHARYHTVVVDGEDVGPLETTPGPRRYEVVAGLPPGEHELTLLRRTEGHLGPTTLLGVEVDGPLRPVPEPAARIEAIGDSITTGYGNGGSSRYCRYSPRTQDHGRTYVAQAARAVGAELSTVAWSGKGVVHNYGDNRFEPMPVLYERRVPTEPEDEPPSWAPADVVVLNLGTNDFSTEDDPSQEEFVAGYVALLARIRHHHPDAEILAAVAPLLRDGERVVVEVYIDQAIELRQRLGDASVRRIDLHVRARGWGCDWHPSAATHAVMAERLEPELRRALR